MISLLENELNKLIKIKRPISIVQIGAHAGNTINDPVNKFLTSEKVVNNRIVSKAILVEPVTHIFKQLMENYSNYDNVEFENVAIAETEKISMFYSLKENYDKNKFPEIYWLDQLGSLLPERINSLWDKYEKDPEIKKFLQKNLVVNKIKCTTLSSLAKKYSLKDIDFLQIDAEGYDYKIIKSINFDKFKPYIINYERVLLNEDELKCRELLEKHGYKCVDDGLDTLAISPELHQVDYSFGHDYDLTSLKKVYLDNFKMEVTPRFYNHYIQHEYESFSARIVQNYIKPGKVFVDVGAHYGYFSLLANSQKNKIIAIEPVFENFQILKRNLKSNHVKALKLINGAASDKNGTFDFNMSEASDSSGFTVNPEAKTKEIIKTKTYTLDSQLTDYVKNIDFIKIDVEGNEIEVINGLKNTLKRNKNIRMIVEFNPKCQIQSGKNPNELLSKLEHLGFENYIIDEQNSQLYRLTNNIHPWTDFISPDSYCNLLCLPKNKSSYTLYFSHSSYLGGAERSLLELLEKNQDIELMSSVIVPDNYGELISSITKRGISYNVIDYSWWAGVHKEITTNDIETSLRNLFNNIPLIEKINPHNIFTNTAVIPWGSITANILGLHHIWKIDEFIDIDHQLKIYSSISDISKYIYRNSETLIFNSNAVRKYFENHYLKPHGEVLYYDFDSKAIEAKAKETTTNLYKYKDSLKLICIGGISKGKNQLLGVSVCSNLIKNNHNIELLLLGKFDENDKYYKKVKKIASFTNRIIFQNQVQNPYPYIKTADVSILCSNNEAFGRVTVESMLLGKPVIGTNSGGTPEIITKNSGLLYKPNNKIELRNCILKLYQDKNLLKILSRKSHTEAHHQFCKHTYSLRIEYILKKLARKKIYDFKNNLYKSLYDMSDAKHHSIQINQYSIQIRDLTSSQQSLSGANTQIKNENQRLINELTIIKNSKFFKLYPYYEKIKSIIK